MHAHLRTGDIVYSLPTLPAQIEVLIAEIPEDLQQKAKRRVCLAMDKYDIEKDIATDVKKHFDEECEGSWHCVVRNVASQAVLCTT